MSNTKFAVGDEVFGKFQGREGNGVIACADDMTGCPDRNAQHYAVLVDDGYGEEVTVTGYENEMTLVRAAS